MNNNNVYISLVGKDKVSGTLKNVNRGLAGLSGAARTAGKALVIGFGLATAAAGVAAAAIGKSVGAASNLSETVNKANVIFGESAASLIEWSKGSAEALGQSQQKALDAASSFAVFGKGAGLSGGKLVDFSTQLTTLSADFASFYNKSPEDAILAIGAALRGESEPIRKFGVLLNETTLRQRALKMGLVKTTKEALTPQIKTLAAQAEILAQSKIAQGDFARTSEGFANQQRIVAAQLENVSVELGTAFLPAFSEVLNLITRHVIPKFKELIPKFTEFVKKVVDGALKLRDKLAPAFGAVVAVIRDEILPKLRELWKFIRDNVLPALGDFAQWAIDNKTPLIIIGGAIAGIAAALKLKALFLGLVTTATALYTAAQWALNAALTANPIGVVVMAIAALVGAIVAAYAASEDFRNVVNGVFEALQPVGEFLAAVFVGTLKSVVAVVELAVNALSTLFDLIGKVVSAIAESPIGQLIGGIAGFAGNLLGANKPAPIYRSPATSRTREFGPEMRVPGLGTPLLSREFTATPAMATVGYGGASLTGRDLREAMQGMAIVLDGEKVGRAVDLRLARSVRTAQTSSRLK